MVQVVNVAGSGVGRGEAFGIEIQLICVRAASDLPINVELIGECLAPTRWYSFGANSCIKAWNARVERMASKRANGLILVLQNIPKIKSALTHQVVHKFFSESFCVWITRPECCG